MSQRSSTNPKKWPNLNDNPLESLKNFGNPPAGSKNMDQFFGDYDDYENWGEFGYKPEAKKPARKKVEFKVFNYQEYYENQKIRQEIKQLTELIKREVEMLKRADKALTAEVKDIQKLTVESLPTKPGIYHIRFLEIVLSILKTIRAKVSESATWLEAMKSKKKKRGSLFVNLSKKKGTQYSLSGELSTSRSVQ